MNNIEYHSNDSDIYACGDTLYVTDDHEYKMILDSRGNILAEGFKWCDIIGEMYSITYDYETYTIYDFNMNKLFDCPNNIHLSKIENAQYLFKYSSYDENNNLIYGVIDSSGKTLFEPKFKSIYEYNDGLFVVAIDKENSLHGLCDMNGNVIVPCEYEYIEYENGYYKGKKQDTKVDIDDIDNIRIKVAVRSDVNSAADNLKLCKIQGKYSGTVIDVHKGVCFIRLNNGVNAVAHSCRDRRYPGKKDDVSFTVTSIDEERGTAVGIITRIIKQNL